MIVTCPSCSTSYNVPQADIGIEGRHVKCRKCQHVWFHEGERKALDDLISRIQSSDIEIDNIVFDDPKNRNKSKEKITALQKARVFLNKILKNLSFSITKESLLKHCAAFMVACALFSTLCYVLVSQRWGIVKAMPSLSGIYESAGFPLFAYANLNPEGVLIIEKASVQSIDKTKSIQGNLINLSSSFVRVPSIRISYVDEKNNIVLENKQSLPIPMIQKEFSYGFNLALPDNLPDTVKTIRLNFVD